MTTKNKMSYANGKIYKIIGTDPEDKCYVGSTTKKYLSQRFVKHVSDYYDYKSGKRQQNKVTSSIHIFDKYGGANCKIILLELCNVTSKDELRMREQYYIDTLDCVNKYNAIQTPEQLKQYKQEWGITHRDEIAKQKKIYHETNKDELSAKKKIYRDNNVEKVKEGKRLERIKNADRYKANAEENIHCDVCDCDIRKHKKNRHEKTLKHLKNLEN